jgi:two-component system NarL family sensor kinase
MSAQNYQIVTGVVIATIVFLLAGFLIIILIAYSNSRKKKFIEEKQIMQSEFQNELLQTQLEIQEQTLKTISQEIHDNIGQALSLAKLNLNTMPATNDEQLQQKIINSKELVSKAIVDLRDLSRSLDTDYVQEMGLLRAIEYELELIRKTGTMETQLQIEGTASRSDKQKELILFRIVQETFNNIIKHAEAKSIKVNVCYNPAELIMLITDDGKGVDLSPLNEQANSGFGLGIRNMHNRAKLIGADFSMQSSLGKGTEVKIILTKQNSNANKQ